MCGAGGEDEAVGILFPVLDLLPGPEPDLGCQHLECDLSLGRGPQNFKMDRMPSIVNPFSMAC